MTRGVCAWPGLGFRREWVCSIQRSNGWLASHGICCGEQSHTSCSWKGTEAEEECGGLHVSSESVPDNAVPSSTHRVTQLYSMHPVDVQQVLPEQNDFNMACQHAPLICLQAALQSLTLPAYAPDIRAGRACSSACLQPRVLPRHAKLEVMAARDTLMVSRLGKLRKMTSILQVNRAALLQKWAWIAGRP